MTALPADKPTNGSISALDVTKVRADFPCLDQTVHDQPLVFLDSAASAQKPRQVIEAISQYYANDHANVHRGVHTLSHRATDAFERARESVRRFVNAASVREIVFTRGTTEAINLVASGIGDGLGRDDEILITGLEHHSNIVPWQRLCERSGATLRVLPIDRSGNVLIGDAAEMLNDSTRIVAVAHVSNALGTILPIEKLCADARARGIPTLIDGAQAVPHSPVDVQAIDCDFYAFSGHKMYGPTGIGVLYGREQALEALPPYQSGGDMILSVSFSGTTYNELPYRFEAGTPPIAGAIGLGAAIDYLEALGMERVAEHESRVLQYGTEALQTVAGLELIGTAEKKASVLSFNIEGIHPHDLGTVLDHQGIAIRTGHHCAMPVMEFLGIAGTARASLGIYNDTDDLDRLVAGLELAQRMFKS